MAAAAARVHPGEEGVAAGRDGVAESKGADAATAQDAGGLAPPVAVAPSGRTGVEVVLLEEESKDGFLYVGAVTTVTLYSRLDDAGEAAGAEAAAAAPSRSAADSVRERLRLVLGANPWLTGHLERASKKERVRLVYDDVEPTDASVASVFEVAAEADLALGVPLATSYGDAETFRAVSAALIKSRANVPPGMKQLNKGAPVSRFTVVTDLVDAPRFAFALVASVSHTVADGYTYYALMNMLSARAPVGTLRVARKEHYSADWARAVGADVHSMVFGTTFAMNYAGTMLFHGKPRVHLRLVDGEVVAAAKRAVKDAGVSGVKFVSTNDVVTSAVGRLLRARLLVMAINFRRRLRDVEEVDAGNYEGSLVFNPEDYQSPALIRKALVAGARGAGGPTFVRASSGDGDTKPTPLPSGCELLHCRIAMVTNWATFARDVEVEGHRQELHMPVLETSGVGVPLEMVVLWRPREGQVGVAFLTRCATADA
eukprot:CAMPEP_0203830648 /NCGR_PEP_ID=MMETSP0115-20131106/66466_1 /ASSEMBLY_ACC=CAM_ASM_000227 /TAXON_ID=33651 /ORGANISM="Bicosoecid sp, Strain ms1" /LENGTH=484 /DNA_ID=CAMNT_0050739709 /DNA_START=86 /DNA_END=1536 /DNA_ORIENTATION=-